MEYACGLVPCRIISETFCIKPNGKWLLNNYLERVVKEAVIAQLKEFTPGLRQKEYRRNISPDRH
jgi:hypothetical protein